MPRNMAAAVAASYKAAPGLITAGTQGSEILSYSQSDRTQICDIAEALGMQWFRVEVNYQYCQIGGAWSEVDNLCTDFEAHGIKPLGLLNNDPNDQIVNTTNFANFAATAATRYAGRIDTWEVWNEPNISQWSVAQYVTLLNATYTAIKGVDSALTVLAGSTAPGTDGYGTEIDPRTFMTGVYAAGAGGHFDHWSHHPYTWPFPPSEIFAGSAWQQMTDMRATMVANGDSEKIIWLTEWGAPTGTGEHAVSEADQASQMAEALSLCAASPWMGPIFIHSIHDNGTDLSAYEQNFGITRNNWTHKPAYAVF